MTPGSGDIRRLWSAAPDAEAGRLVRYLELADRHPAIREAGLSARTFLAGARALLDVGCGLGRFAHTVRPALAPRARLVGLDVNPALLGEARRRAPEDASVRFVRGDAQRLPFPDGSFDACHAERLLIHLKRPAAALREGFRVLGRSGRIFLTEPDLASLEIEGPDAGTMRRLVGSWARGVAAPGVGRRLPRELEAAGFGDVKLETRRVVHESREVFEELTDFTRVVLARRPSPVERSWLASLEERARAGRFRASYALLSAAAHKPAGTGGA